MTVDHAKHPAPVLVADLFPELEAGLVSLLLDLAPEDWNRPTVCRGWAVRDVAAHLLDGAARRLSIQRDKHWPPSGPAGNDYPSLVEFLNQLNASWVGACQRLSPQLLLRFLEITSRELCEHVQHLDPYGQALFPVAWAGESSSLCWFDVAREFTERWHHQQQIRDAVDRPGFTERRFLHPVLDTFFRALPYGYRLSPANEGSVVAVEVSGAAGGTWWLIRRREVWDLSVGPHQPIVTKIRLDQDLAWRLLTNGVTRTQALAGLEITGDHSLAAPLLELRAVMV